MRCVGADIIEIARIQRAIIRWEASFLKRVYTDLELGLCRGRAASLAARFVGKEAVMKALGTGRRGVTWKEIEILAEPGGKPRVQLYRKAQKQANNSRITSLAISLSHSREYAIAFVVGEIK